MLVLKKKTEEKPKFGGKEIPFKVDRIMSVDPGLGGTGWAIWEASTWDKLEKPAFSGAIELKGKDIQAAWYDRIGMIKMELEKIYYHHRVNCTFIELPEYMAAGVGLTAAARGDLIKLTITAGILAFHNYSPLHKWFPVPVSEWKGQMAKDQTTARIYKKIKIDYTNKSTHEADAVGLGLYCKGFF